ncbi:TPA: hypothetical protein ACJOHM_003640, partial [Vibrio cholerae]
DNHAQKFFPFDDSHAAIAMLFSLFLEIPAFSVSAFLLYRHRRISNDSSAGVYHCFSSYPRALLALSGCGVSYASFVTITPIIYLDGRV